MRYSDLAGKEIIDIHQGARLGVVGETDLVINLESGYVDSIIVPYSGGLFHRRELVIPWTGIKKVGIDLIIVDMSEVREQGGYG